MNEFIKEWGPQITQVITLLLSIVAILITVLKTPSEIGNNTSTSAKTYADVAMSYADEVRNLRVELEDSRKNCDDKIASLEKEKNIELKILSAERDKEISDLKLTLSVMQGQITELLISKNKIENWAKRLATQVIDLGGTPVPFEEKL